MILILFSKSLSNSAFFNRLKSGSKDLVSFQQQWNSSWESVIQERGSEGQWVHTEGGMVRASVVLFQTARLILLYTATPDTKILNKKYLYYSKCYVSVSKWRSKCFILLLNMFGKTETVGSTAVHRIHYVILSWRHTNYIFIEQVRFTNALKIFQRSPTQAKV